MTNVVRYLGESHRGLSPNIWGDISKVEQDARQGLAAVFHDDFITPTLHAAANANGGYFTQQTNATIEGLGTTVAPDIATELGVLRVTGYAANNDLGHIQFGHGGNFRISGAADLAAKVLFESRLAVNTVADNTVSWFLGFARSPIGAGDLADTTGAIADISYVGFLSVGVAEGAGNKISLVYRKGGQAAQVVQANAAEYAADTYVKLGLKYNPGRVDGNDLKFFVEGEELEASVTAAQILAATFPHDHGLAPVFLSKRTGADAAFKLDWVAGAQYQA
jgi:hypothetical protein